MRSLRVLAAALAFIVAGSALPGWCAAALVVRTSDADGIRVAVQPQTGAPVDGRWDFAVSMDTHIKPLTGDLVQAAVLIDDADRRVAPTAWKGDPPGGHHRKGILQFTWKGAAPKSVQLQIDRIGGGGKRVFRWQLN
jgi:hypothetical protein